MNTPSTFDIKSLNNPATFINHVNQLQEKLTNSFPVEIFPKPVQDIITETNNSLEFPVDFIAASMLFAASVAIGNTHKVEIKKGFQENAVLYLAIVARAGTNKSHPLSFAIQPIVEHDKTTYRQYEQQKQEYESIMKLSPKERKAEGITEDPVQPVWQKMLLSDFTPEALAEVHKFNRRGIGVYVDELAGWFKNFNRYSKGSEMEFWLSAWNSKPINIDRKSNGPVFIPSPFVSVAGTIQNGVLKELAKENRTQNGFIDRILFAFPDNIRKPYWSDTEINPDIIHNWQTILTNLLSIPLILDNTHNPEPETLRFRPEAKKLLFDWQKENADRYNETEDETISGIYSKLEMYVARFALILELLQWACGESNREAVGLKAVSGAIKLVDYFKRSAIKVYSIISNSDLLEKYPNDKKELFRALPQKFTTEEGVRIALERNVPERSFKRFLKQKELFQNVSRGVYEKFS
ncbi:DUF3987 domain-containing protein [Candidatus Sulfidibacterium hydrothermale]|uniref:YfjI family protein n=1 Tax=Candidatus Sulfidibacterium hydrothermale TaxID=2875962 RepID=UPI001F0B653D|nr:YfjI family protein [Candidatus Sulfidibacterium hydrothermale]UBM61524.1 DUF3987 domain-containing protein [Candidatus Sulfidibacterium hydrothermale]